MKRVDLNSRGIYEVLIHTSLSSMKKRENIRLALVLALRGLFLIREEEMLNKESKKLIMAKYYQVGLKFCLNEEDRLVLRSRFDEVFADFRLENDRPFSVDAFL